jgi:hypothetical protein
MKQLCSSTKSGKPLPVLQTTRQLSQRSRRLGWISSKAGNSITVAWRGVVAGSISLLPVPIGKDVILPGRARANILALRRRDFPRLNKIAESSSNPRLVFPDRPDSPFRSLSFRTVNREIEISPNLDRQKVKASKDEASSGRR